MNRILDFWDIGVILATFLISWFIVRNSYQKMNQPKNTLDEHIDNPNWDFRPEKVP